MTPADFDALYHTARFSPNACSRRDALNAMRTEHMTQEATIAYLREECARYEAMWHGAEDRADALADELELCKAASVTSVK